MRALAHHQAERDNVALDPRHTADHRVMTDAHDLVHPTEAADDDVIPDLDVAAERRVVGHHDADADRAIVRDVRADHEQSAAADPRYAAAADRSGIHGDVLANDVIWADLEPGRFASVFEILRRVAQ